MREALTCWIAYVSNPELRLALPEAHAPQLALRWVSSVPERLFGWLPFYAPVKLVLFAGFMFTRTAVSRALAQATLHILTHGTDFSVFPGILHSAMAKAL